MASHYEINRADQIVDVRPWGTRAAEVLADPPILAACIGGLMFFTLAFPVLLPITTIAMLTVLIASKGALKLLPLRYPPKSINPDNGKPGDGIWYLGNMEFAKKKADRLPLETISERFKEVWLGDDDMRKHLLVLGSTGSGKSELLKGIFFCALCWGSGFFVADGKADNKLPTDTYNLTRFFGRDDDLLSMNFLLAGKTPEQVRNSRRRRTNKTNPFSTADADTIVQMGANLLPKVDGDAKNWQEKALNCWRGLVPALCWLRDHEAKEISVTTFVDYLALPKLEELYARGYILAQQNNGVWNEGFVGIKSYLEVGLPGFKLERCLKKHGAIPAQRSPMPGGKPEPMDQESGVYDQHGYRATQLNPALNLLDKTYGHIFQDKFSEIDMVDVTLNNRILVLMIPSLEKSAQEAESLGKLTVACLRVMMGKNLGAEIEGTRAEIMESKATEARYPYIVALDELGYYFADGIAVMFAQARSLGFSMIAAAQDIEKLTEGSRAAEAGAMLANQVTKIFMRIDDANKTNEMIQKYLGKVNVALKKTYEFRDSMGFKRMPEVTLEEIPVATLQNLQNLGAGRAVINTMGQTFKIASFYVGDFLQQFPTESFHINRFLQVRGLSQDEIEGGITTESGTELISMPMDVLNDKYVKGSRLHHLLTGDEAMPDIRAVADQASYSAKHDKALGMVNAVADVARKLPPNIVGAQRAIVLYQAAQKFVSEARDGFATGGAGAKGDALRDNTQANMHPSDVDLGEAFVTPGQAAGAAADPAAATVLSSGGMISQGSGSGEGADSLSSPHEVDPFDFINDSKPLERKPVASVLAVAPKITDTVALMGGAMSGVAELLKEGAQSAGNAEEAMSEPELTGKFAEVVQVLIDDGEALDFSSIVPQAPRQFDNEKATADAKWIGKALAGAAINLAAKGDTVVGFTEQTKVSFQRVESALGNQNALEAAGAIEQLVAQQTTPAPMDDATGADFEDLNALLSDVEAGLSK